MGTKRNPGDFDCYANAEPDEPMFVLLGRDPLAPALVELWRAIRVGDSGAAAKATQALITSGDWAKNKFTDAKMNEAAECANAMRAWIARRAPERGR